MKGAYFYGHEKIKVEEVRKPSVDSDSAIVKVAYCGVCGSDRFKWHEAWAFPLDEGTKPDSVGRLKYILGHETVGTITEIGKNVNGLKVGDRVAIYCIKYCGKCIFCKQGYTNWCVDFDKGIMSDHWDGGYADYVKVPKQCLLKLPDDISFELGDLSLDTLGCPYEALRRLEEVGVNKDSSIVIYGCGPIGLAMIKILNLKGYKTVVALDISDYKLKIAKEMGASNTINVKKVDNPVKAVKEMFDGLGPDVAMDIAGIKETEKNAVSTPRKGGKVYLMGEQATMELQVSTCLHQNLTLLFGVYYRIEDFGEIVKLLREGKDDFKKIITHIIPLSEIDKGFDIFFNNPDSIRVLIKPTSV